MLTEKEKDQLRFILNQQGNFNPNGLKEFSTKTDEEVRAFITLNKNPIIQQLTLRKQHIEETISLFSD